MNHPFNVLLAEDNEDDAFLLQEAFKRAGVNSPLHVVCDGIEARSYLMREDPYQDPIAHPMPDLLLLDLNMPRMNGFEVLQWIRKSDCCNNLIVHVLTASARQIDVSLAYELGANSYIVKPSHLAELVEFVSALHKWHRFTVLPKKPDKKQLVTSSP